MREDKIFTQMVPFMLTFQIALLLVSVLVHNRALNSCWKRLTKVIEITENVNKQIKLCPHFKPYLNFLFPTFPASFTLTA